MSILSITDIVLLLIILLLLLGGGGGYYARGRWGAHGLTGILIIMIFLLIIVWVLDRFPYIPPSST